MDNNFFIKSDSVLSIPKIKKYKINVDKIQTIEDIKLIFSIMNLQCYFTEEQAEPIKHLLEEE